MNLKEIAILAAAGFGLYYMLTKSSAATAATINANANANANAFVAGDPAFNPNANYQAPFQYPPVAPSTNNPTILTNGAPAVWT